AGLVRRVHPAVLDPRGTGTDRGARVARDGPPAHRRQRSRMPHRAQDTEDRRGCGRRPDRRPDDPAPANPREVRVDAALAAGVGARVARDHLIRARNLIVNWALFALNTPLGLMRMASTAGSVVLPVGE